MSKTPQSPPKKEKRAKPEPLEARLTIEEYTRLQLSLEDSQAFVEALLSPPEPNARMMAAAAEYKQAIASH